MARCLVGSWEQYPEAERQEQEEKQVKEEKRAVPRLPADVSASMTPEELWARLFPGIPASRICNPGEGDTWALFDAADQPYLFRGTTWQETLEEVVAVACGHPKSSTRHTWSLGRLGDYQQPNGLRVYFSLSGDHPLVESLFGKTTVPWGGEYFTWPDRLSRWRLERVAGGFNLVARGVSIPLASDFPLAALSAVQKEAVLPADSRLLFFLWKVATAEIQVRAFPDGGVYLTASTKSRGWYPESYGGASLVTYPVGPVLSWFQVLEVVRHWGDPLWESAFDGIQALEAERQQKNNNNTAEEDTSETAEDEGMGMASTKLFGVEEAWTLAKLMRLPYGVELCEEIQNETMWISTGTPDGWLNCSEGYARMNRGDVVRQAGWRLGSTPRVLSSGLALHFLSGKGEADLGEVLSTYQRLVLLRDGVKEVGVLTAEEDHQDDVIPKADPLQAQGRDPNTETMQVAWDTALDAFEVTTAMQFQRPLMAMAHKALKLILPDAHEAVLATEEGKALVSWLAALILHNVSLRALLAQEAKETGTPAPFALPLPYPEALVKGAHLASRGQALKLSFLVGDRVGDFLALAAGDLTEFAKLAAGMGFGSAPAPASDAPISSEVPEAVEVEKVPVEG